MGRFVVLALLILMSHQAPAEGPAAKPTGASASALPLTIDVHGDERGISMLPSAQLLRDPEGALDFAAAKSSPQWTDTPESLSFGFSTSTWWVRWRIRNAVDRALTGVIDLGHPCQDYVEWRVVRDGSIDVSRSGDRLPFSERKLPVHTLALPLRLAPYEEVEVYVRLRSHDGLFEPLSVKYFAIDEFIAVNSTENLLTTLFYGALLALALYNLLLYVATREGSFGAYALYALCFLTWNFTFRGYSFQYLWPNSPALNNDFLTVGVAWTFASIGWFAVVYLRMRAMVPRWVYRLNVGMVLVNVSVTAVALTGHYALGAALSQVLGIALVVVTQTTAVWLLRRGSRQARFFVIAFALITVGVGAYILQIIGALPTNWFTTWAIQVGSALEMLLLALGVADSMNTLKSEKLQAERREREAQEALNAKLAQQVSERTEQLADANRRLHELAVTDELTGAFNRRHFNAYCAAALAHHKDGAPLAFCKFDLDHFRSFNEYYGQSTGDETLRRVSDAVRGSFDGSGAVLFRLGGEEFGVLFSTATPAEAASFGEKLWEALSALEVAHAGVAGGKLTASFGLGWWGGGGVGRLTPDRIYAVADNMLFEAKEAGGDCIRLDARFANASEGLHSIDHGQSRSAGI